MRAKRTKSVAKLGIFFAFVVANTHAWAASCSVEIGRPDQGRDTYQTLSFKVEHGAPQRSDNLQNARAVFQTSGPCSFRFFEKAGYQGRSITIGTNLDRWIRFGIDGIENRLQGTNNTWDAKSLIVEAAEHTDCTMRVGNLSITMDYHQNVRNIPLSRVIHKTLGTSGTQCLFTAHDSPDLKLATQGYRQMGVGQDLSSPIYAGPMGVLNRAEQPRPGQWPAGTWDMQSLTVFRLREELAASRCWVTVGAPHIGNPSGPYRALSMKYYGNEWGYVPEMTYAYAFGGQNCNRLAFFEDADYNRTHTKHERQDYMRKGKIEEEVGFGFQSIGVFQ
ncbi:MAG: hypothetical protein R3B54_00840 [Bdellovibrionota bacterium]